MSTIIKPELSLNSEYYISKNRYYELKYYCLQYLEWEKLYTVLSSERAINCPLVKMIDGELYFNPKTDKVVRLATKLADLKSKMDMVECTCRAADPELWNYIFIAVTKNHTYEYLKIKYNIPCCRNTYYDRYRKFFWLLSMVRG